MTEENQKRRAYLSEIEAIIHETLASQPAEDDSVRCGRALDRGIVRIDEVVRKYKAEWNWVEPSGRTVQCTGCGRTVPLEQAHGMAVLRPDGTVSQGCRYFLCDKCHDAELAVPHGVPSWTMSGRHG